jgi:hypothetical protein
MRVPLVLLLGVACASAGVEVESDPDADLSRWVRYAWSADSAVALNDPVLDVASIDRQLRSAVERELASRGYRHDPGRPADFLVGYHLALEEKRSVTTLPDLGAYEGGRVSGAARSRTYEYVYDEGTLTLELLDPASRRSLWRGTVRAEADRSRSPEQRRERLEAAVRDILERLPTR